MTFTWLILWMLRAVLPNPQVAAGTLKIHEDFQSQFVTARTIYVWLPDEYDPNGSYPVLYMHDGQMLWDSTTTWNQQDWGVDETMQRLINAEEIPPCIIVGIASLADERHADYFPGKPFLSLPPSIRDSLLQVGRGTYPLLGHEITSDEYLKFIVHELKPMIDQTYATHGSRGQTFIAGSSMGGLISMYAFFEYPEVFGGAACLSTHWIGGFAQNDAIPKGFQDYITARKELIRNRRLYFDHGTETLDAMYPPHQHKVNAIFESMDLTANDYWMSRIFEGDAHDERSWRDRLDIPLKFFFNP
jgi:enterochelin esterase-like enzyme